MEIKENISLKKFNTFGIDVSARYFASFRSSDELVELLGQKDTATINHTQAPLILGDGSNILFTKNFNGLVLKNNITGFKIIKEDAHHLYVQAGAGENWHQFVLYCINKGWAGVENLSLIPGNVGAAPIQNIGAYGSELKEVFYCLEALDLNEKKLKEFSVNDCAFGYRDSVFKRECKAQFGITSVTFRLNKIPTFNISYGSIGKELEVMGVRELSIKSISDAIIRIRSSKLPDPQITGNAGSFFKNPIVTAVSFGKLKSKFPKIVGYRQENGDFKLAAGWLIEDCGWKGFRRGDAGCHAWQSLVLVNYGNALGSEIYSLSGEIIQSVIEKFGILLEREVNII